MTYRLLKQDRAWKIAKGWIAFIGVLILARWIWQFYFPVDHALRAAQNTHAADVANQLSALGHVEGDDVMTVVYASFTSWIWLFVYGTLYLLQTTAEPWRRVTPSLQSLPVPRRDILASRLIALSVSVWSCFFAAYLLFDILQPMPWTPAWRLLGFPAAATIEIAAHQCKDIRQEKGTSWLVPLSWALALGTLGVAWSPSSFVALAYPAALLLGAAGLFVSAWRKVPPAFDRVPEGKKPVERLYQWISGAAGTSPQPEFNATLSNEPDIPFRSSKPRPIRKMVAIATLRNSVWLIFWAGMLFVMGFLCSAPGWSWAVVAPMQANAAIHSLMNAMRGTFNQDSFRFLRWITILPISPGRVLRWTAVAAIAVTLSGYAFGLTGPGWLSLHVSTTQGYEERGDNEPTPACTTLNIKPPLQFWEQVKGQPPVIRAPWGEEFQPPASQILGVEAYNPFAVGCTNTKRFFDWQFEQATTALYGRPAQYTEYKQLPGARPRGRNLIVNVTFFIAVVLISGIGGALGSWRRIRFLPRWLRLTLTGVVGTSIPIAVMIFTLRRKGFRTDVVSDPLMRIVWVLPDNLYLIAAITGVTIVALYWLFDRLSRKMEISATSVSGKPL